MCNEKHSLHKALSGAFGAALLSQFRCRDVILRWLHPAGPRCPHCKEPTPESKRHTWHGGRSIRCTGCGQYYNAFTSTPLAGAKISPSQLVLLAFLTDHRWKNREIARATGLSSQSVRVWRSRLKEL